MGRTIKTRHVQKDIKVLDKTVTAAEHMKGAYIRTRDSAEQTQIKEQGNPVGYAEDQVMEKGERTGNPGRLCRRPGYGERGESRPWNSSAGRKTGGKSNPCCAGEGQSEK